MTRTPVACGLLLMWSMMLSFPTEAHFLGLFQQDKPALQRGARVFMNYCSGCHSLRYLRYNRMARDLGLTSFDGTVDKPLLLNNLLFTQAKIEDPIRTSMPPELARKWFGVIPPDLSLIAREKGPTWIIAYLSSFYADSSRPFGSNNQLVPFAAMPNVFEPLVGQIELTSGGLLAHRKIAPYDNGTMGSQEFQNVLQDLVTFLVYVAEPERETRKEIGLVVIIFLMLLLVVAYQLKQLYWRGFKITTDR